MASVAGRELRQHICGLEGHMNRHKLAATTAPPLNGEPVMDPQCSIDSRQELIKLQLSILLSHALFGSHMLPQLP